MCVLFLHVEVEAQANELVYVHCSGGSMQQCQDLNPLCQGYELVLQHKPVPLIWREITSGM